MAGQSGSGILLLMQTVVGPPGTYVLIGGQSGSKIDRKTAVMDFTDKSTADTQVQPGKRSSTITLDAFYIANDAAMTAVRNAYKTGGMIIAERQENGNVLEYANCVITDLSDDAKANSPATSQITLEVSAGWQTGSAP